MHPDRYRLARQIFRRHFSAEPTHLVAAPGRVNLIGEHTDYNGLPVMPLALDREIVIAFTPAAGPVVSLVTGQEMYPPREFELAADIPADEPGDWGNYAKAAAVALWGWAAEHAPDRLPLQGFRGAVIGDVPPAAGLSSSSALVVAAACALVEVNGLPIGKAELADLLAQGERYVGTQGGGMDQAVSLLAEPGGALLIDFFPLRAQAVPLPAGCAVVVANSLVTAGKAAGARLAYNTRVAECRLGLAMLKARRPQAAEAALLRDFMAVEDWPAALDELPDEPLGLAEIAAWCGASAGQLAAACPLPPGLGDSFAVKRRCRHVLTEGARVYRAAAHLRAGELAALGRLLDESHQSCAEDYEISCPELDALVTVLRARGALGARLTGAGFGGCAVGIVPAEQVERLLAGVWRDYYELYLPAAGGPTPKPREEVLFACRPGRGAGVREL